MNNFETYWLVPYTVLEFTSRYRNVTSDSSVKKIYETSKKEVRKIISDNNYTPIPAMYREEQTMILKNLSLLRKRSINMSDGMKRMNKIYKKILRLVEQGKIKPMFTSTIMTEELIRHSTRAERPYTVDKKFNDIKRNIEIEIDEMKHVTYHHVHDKNPHIVSLIFEYLIYAKGGLVLNKKYLQGFMDRYIAYKYYITN